MCLYTKLIRNKRYTKNKKNGGQVPSVIDTRIEYVPVGCGNCIECRKQKQREWLVRLQEHIKTHTNGKYIVLTFSNESIIELSEQTINKTNSEGKIEKIQIKNLKGYERDNAIATKGIRLFLERWRKEFKISLHHWTITELGHNGTENIHLHGILWTDETYDTIERIWKYGWIFPRKKYNTKLGWVREHTYVNEKTINYNTKYVSKIDKQHKEYKGIILTSPGIGKNYIETPDAERNNFKGKETNETYRTSTGHKISLPIYWRNKIYSETDKERLWIQRLDKQIRWVCGEQVDISKGNEQYDKMVQWHRQRNAQLGYGMRPNENRKEHEEAKREIMYQTRIHNATWSEEHKKEIQKRNASGGVIKGTD